MDYIRPRKLGDAIDPSQFTDIKGADGGNRNVRWYRDLKCIYFSRSDNPKSCKPENIDAAEYPLQILFKLVNKAMEQFNREAGVKLSTGPQIEPKYILGVNFIKKGVHGPRSLHPKGLAVDFSFRNMSKGRPRRFFRPEEISKIYRLIKKYVFEYETDKLQCYAKTKISSSPLGGTKEVSLPKEEWIEFKASLGTEDINEKNYRIRTVAENEESRKSNPDYLNAVTIFKRESPDFYKEVENNTSSFRQSVLGKVYTGQSKGYFKGVSYKGGEDSPEGRYKIAIREIGKIYGSNWINIFKDFDNEDSTLRWSDHKSTTLSTDYDIIYESDHFHLEYDPDKRGGVSNPPPAKDHYLTVREDGVQQKNQYYVYVHSDFGITTIDQLLKAEFSNFEVFNNDKNALLDFEGDTKKTNRKRIEDSYLTQDKNNPDIKQDVESLNYLKIGTHLLIPAGEITRNFLVTKDINQSIPYTNQPGYTSERLHKIQNLPNYFPTRLISDSSTHRVNVGSPYFVVWIYIRALNKILDITRFIQDISLTNLKQLSAFSFTLSSIKDMEDILNNQSLYSSSNIDGKLSYFHKYINENDVVWIRMEELDCETNRKVRRVSFKVDKSELAGNIYDMIGLVDKSSAVTMFQGADDSVKVSGRDLSKMFVDDEALFFPLSVVTNSESKNLMLGNNENDKILKRTFYSEKGSFDFLFAKLDRPINKTLLFYINQLANIGILPDDENENFFSSYVGPDDKGVTVDRRSRVFRLKEGPIDIEPSTGDSVNEDYQKITTKLQNGLYQIIKLGIDPLIQNRRIVDDTVANPNGNLLSLFNKICKEPLVELFTDTYGDTYNIVARKPPFDYSSIMSYLDDESSIVSIEGSDVSDTSLDFDTEGIVTWYRFDSKGVFLGDADSTALTYIPIVYFSELVDIFGSRPLVIESNYVYFDSTKDKDSQNKFEAWKEAAINDLMYIIECNIYKPFTRKGTIRLSHSDRRIKIGNYIRYKPSGELFYVDQVSHSASVIGSASSETTISVSRGMVEKYISKVEQITTSNNTYQDYQPSYFNLINTENIKRVLLKFLQKGDSSQAKKDISISRDMKMDKDTLNFFLQRKQFD